MEWVALHAPAAGDNRCAGAHAPHCADRLFIFGHSCQIGCGIQDGFLQTMDKRVRQW